MSTELTVIQSIDRSTQPTIVQSENPSIVTLECEGWCKLNAEFSKQREEVEVYKRLKNTKCHTPYSKFFL